MSIALGGLLLECMYACMCNGTVVAIQIIVRRLQPNLQRLVSQKGVASLKQVPCQSAQAANQVSKVKVYMVLFSSCSCCESRGVVVYPLLIYCAAMAPCSLYTSILPLWLHPKVPMCFHLCILPLVTCPGFWIDDIIGSCQTVSAPPMCTQVKC